MKKIFVLLMGSTLLFGSCNSQEEKPVVLGEKVEPANFEEKQKKAMENEHPLIEGRAFAAGNFRYAARKATPAVVHIKVVYSMKAEREVPDFLRDFFGDDFFRHYFPPDAGTPQVQVGSASGVIVSNDGYIVTNNHVIAGADSIEVVLHDQRRYKAKVVGADPATDLGLLKIGEAKLPFIEFGNSDSIEVGDWVLAVGNPFNLSSTVTAGIVSAKARNINILTDKYAVESFIQTDAAANPGNSGGALVDVNGRLVGINAAIATPTGSYAGYSFAIPVDIVKKTIDDLLQYGKAMRGYLGIVMTGMDGEKAKILGSATYTGVIVDSLLPNSAAQVAGMKIKDIIIRIDDHVIETAPQFREIIARHHSGEKLQLTVIREGKEKIIPVILKPMQESKQENR